MCAHRGIDAAARAFAFLDDAVQGFSHAVQTLEFEAVLVVSGHRNDGGAGVRVVGRELRIDPVAAVHQHLRAGHVAGVGVDLAGEDREALDPHLLRQLDLGVPVGALDQAHHDLAVKALGHVVERLDHRGGAAPVGLHDDPETVPALEPLVRKHRLDHVERQVETILFLGVDVEADARLGRLPGEVERARQQLLHHRVLVGVFIARMQGRQLDRYAGRRAHVALGLLANDADRLRVGGVIALGILVGARRFAEHVVRIGVALLLKLAGVLHALLDGLPQHELATEDLHRLADGRAHHRLAHALDEAAQHAGRGARVIVQNAARQHQCPGRGIDQRR